MKYHIITLGCQMNYADSERLASYYEARGFERAKNEKESDVVIINTCMVREKAEHKIYSITNNLSQLNPKPKIIVTGCFVGAMEREPSGKMKKYAKRRMPHVDEFLLIDEVGFSNFPKRQNSKTAFLPISNGCNNMCSYCIVPFARGREISRPFSEIIEEAQSLVDPLRPTAERAREIILLGQNVNSYGADLIKKRIDPSTSSADFARDDNKRDDYSFQFPSGQEVKPVIVKSMGRMRIPTLFPYLLEEVAKMPFKMVDFISSNPWDFSDELIEVMAKYKNINREIHLPVQSGDSEILKQMNRWYTREEYLNLIKKITDKIPEVEFTTDIIVGFPGETEEQFNNTVDLCKQVNFNIAHISTYSPRPGTIAEKITDDVDHMEKKRRFAVLDELINKK